jgi:aarF domain-containing kinase
VEELKRQVNKRSATRLLNLCLANGGIYIKAGQHIASLNQVLPVEYTKTMEPCQDRAPTRPFHEIEKLFLEEFNHPMDY